MQYEMSLIALTAFGGFLLCIAVYKNKQAIKAIQKELAEWEKDINRE